MHGVVLFGRPCSGKSTIGREFAKRYGYKYISSGDIARELAERDEKAQADLAAGKMAPEELMRAQVRFKIRMCETVGQNFVLDGFPRFMDQHDFLQKTFPDIRMIYVHIFVSDMVARMRALRRKRNDDEAIDGRLAYFNDHTYEILKRCDITINNNDGGEVSALAMTNRVEELYEEVAYAVGSEV